MGYDRPGAPISASEEEQEPSVARRSNDLLGGNGRPLTREDEVVFTSCVSHLGALHRSAVRRVQLQKELPDFFTHPRRDTCENQETSVGFYIHSTTVCRAFSSRAEMASHHSLPLWSPSINLFPYSFSLLNPFLHGSLSLEPKSHGHEEPKAGQRKTHRCRKPALGRQPRS